MVQIVLILILSTSIPTVLAEQHERSKVPRPISFPTLEMPELPPPPKGPKRRETLLGPQGIQFNCPREDGFRTLEIGPKGINANYLWACQLAKTAAEQTKTQPYTFCNVQSNFKSITNALYVRKTQDSAMICSFNQGQLKYDIAFRRDSEKSKLFCRMDNNLRQLTYEHPNAHIFFSSDDVKRQEKLMATLTSGEDGIFNGWVSCEKKRDGPLNYVGACGLDTEKLDLDCSFSNNQYKVNCDATLGVCQINGELENRNWNAQITIAKDMGFVYCEGNFDYLDSLGVRTALIPLRRLNAQCQLGVEYLRGGGFAMGTRLFFLPTSPIQGEAFFRYGSIAPTQRFDTQFDEDRWQTPQRFRPYIPEDSFIQLGIDFKY